MRKLYIYIIEFLFKSFLIEKILILKCGGERNGGKVYRLKHKRLNEHRNGYSLSGATCMVGGKE